MTSRLADPLYHRLRRTFPPGAPYTRADWDEETMPTVVRHFLEHRLRQHSRREVRQMRRARTASRRYGYGRKNCIRWRMASRARGPSWSP